MAKDDFEPRRRDEQSGGGAGSLRLRISFNSFFQPKGRFSSFNKTTGVLVRGSFRYHKGSQSKSNPGSRMGAHMKYLSGERREQIQNGTFEKRQLYDRDGRDQTASEALNAHKENGIFLEHRIIISPAGRMDESGLHKLAQITIQEIQSRNPSKEIQGTYAIHTDTSHSHAHLVVTSPNRLVLNRDDYQHLREFSHQIRHEIEAERGSYQSDQQSDHERVMNADEYTKEHEQGD